MTSRALVAAIIGLVVASLATIFVFTSSTTNTEQTPQKVLNDLFNTSYTVEGERIVFTDGVFERPVASESATKEVFRIFGVPSYTDIDADGDTDAAFYLVRESGGSGTFYYVGVALNDGDGYHGTNALYLGDRIAPQTLEIRSGRVIANFAERMPDESFATPPSVGKSVWVHYDASIGEIGEFVPDAQGEADPNRMTLTRVTWYWKGSESPEGKTMPKRPNVFTLAFDDANQVRIGTDCNTMGGEYTETGTSLRFKEFMTTLMYCEDSQESEFAATLRDVHSFSFSERGELFLNYGSDGVMRFTLAQEHEAGTPTPRPGVPPPIDDPTPPIVRGGCFAGGCSGQLCTDENDAVSTCEWREEYACYQTAICERQPSGECGWTETPELRACIDTSGPRLPQPLPIM